MIENNVYTHANNRWLKSGHPMQTAVVILVGMRALHWKTKPVLHGECKSGGLIWYHFVQGTLMNHISDVTRKKLELTTTFGHFSCFKLLQFW